MAQVRVLRAKRKKELFDEGSNISIDRCDLNTVQELKSVVTGLNDMLLAMEEHLKEKLDGEEEEEESQDNSASVVAVVKKKKKVATRKQKKKQADSSEDSLFPRTRKLRKVSTEKEESVEEEEEESETKGSEEEEGIALLKDDIDQDQPRETAVQLLGRMKDSVPVVQGLLKLSQRSVGVGKLVVPDPERAEPEYGEVLCKDLTRLSDVLTLTSKTHNVNLVEKLGKLYEWWRLCERAFDIAALLAFLRPKPSLSKKRKVRTLKQRYQDMVKKVASQGVKCCSYKHARKYDKLASFLRQYPCCMYQIELIAIRDWFYWLAEDRLQTVIVQEDDDAQGHTGFWKRIPQEEDDRNKRREDEGNNRREQDTNKRRRDEDVCLQCGTGDDTSELWFCEGCGLWFHDTCCGYQSGSLCKEVVLSNSETRLLDAYCAKCLSEKDLTHEDIVMDVKEHRAVSIYLNDKECPVCS